MISSVISRGSAAVAVAVLLAGLASHANAAKDPVWHSEACDGFGSKCSIGLKEGLEQEVHFHLEEPIICPQDSDEACIVVVNISNSHPEWVAVNPCMLVWTAAEWHQTKTVKVTAVQDYVHENENRQVHLSTQVVGTRSELYLGFNPDDIYIESKKTGSAQCRATGDPHYTTFDGKYWHFYDGNRRQPTRLTYYKSTTRDFVMQVQVRGNPAVACAIAGREGNDRVMINNCGGGINVQASYQTTKVEDQPRIDVSGSTYTVYFKSGAWIRAQVSSWGMNVYTQSVDPGASCGACGNFNGNSGDDAVAYMVRDYNTLFECQKVCTKALEPSCTCRNGGNTGTSMSCDIWEYTPEKKEESSEKVPEAKKFCPFLPSYVKPLIGAQDVEDLTDFLKQHTKEEEDRGVFVFDVDQEDFDAGADKIDEKVALQQCTAAMNGNDPEANAGAKSQLKAMVSGCKSMDDEGGAAFNEKFGDVLIDCTEDLANLGGKETDLGKQELIEAVLILEQTCIELFIRFGHKFCQRDISDAIKVTDQELADAGCTLTTVSGVCTPLIEARSTQKAALAKCTGLKNALCPEQCNGDAQGSCDDAACVCKEGWAGKSCGISTDDAPSVTAISDKVCDTHSSNCPDELEISGKGFYCDKGCNKPDNGWGPKCVYESAGNDDVVVDAQFSGEDLVLCPVPRASRPLGTHRGAVALKTTLRVANVPKADVDGTPLYSEEAMIFTFFDSQCTLCDEDAKCTPNPNTCQVEVNGELQCFRNGDSDPRVYSELGDQTNPCLECVPSKSTTDFSYNFVEEECKPKFDKVPVYEAIIRGKLKKGAVKGATVYIDNQADSALIINGADNAYVNSAPDYSVTYKIDVAPGVSGAEEQLIKDMFEVEATTGQIILNEDVDIDGNCNGMVHCIADPTKFNGFFMVEACHMNGEACTTTSVVIEVEAVNADQFQSIFDSQVYASTIAENPAKGTVLVLDPPIKTKSGVTYSFFSSGINIEPGTLLIDSKGAKITVDLPENINYEAIDTAHCSRATFDTQNKCIGGVMKNFCQWKDNTCTMLPVTIILRAQDSEGSAHIADLHLTITDVKEAPTEVLLSESELEENTPADSVVGVLTCIDPEQGQDAFNGCTFELSTESAKDFAITKNSTASYLRAKKEFNFEDMEGNNEIAVEIRATDADQPPATSDFMSVSLTIIDINEKPVDVVLKPASGFRLSGKEMELSEALGVEIVLGTVSANDPDTSSENDPACQLVQGGEFVTMSGNILRLGKKLDFESAPIVKVGIACIDRPTAGFTPLVSDAIYYTIKVTDANDAPEDLTLTQDVTLDEHEPAGSGPVKIGKVRAVDKDKGSGPFEMKMQEPDVWGLGEVQCAVQGGVQTCSADLMLKKPLSAADRACEAPDANGYVMCTTRLQLTDGSDDKLSSLLAIAPSIRFRDVMDEPTGISLGVSQVVAGWENGYKFGAVTVNDIDGTEGPMGARGHTVTLKSRPANLFGLREKTQGRGRRSGGNVWELVVENSKGINPTYASEIELDFTVTDLMMPDKSFTFSKMLPVVSDGGGAFVGGVTQEAGNVKLETNILIVPFLFADAGAVDSTLELSGEDLPTDAAKVTIVRLQEEDPGGGACDKQSLTPSGENYVSAAAGVTMCEDAGGDDTFDVVDFADADGSSGTVSVRPSSTALAASYSRSAKDLYLKVEKKKNQIVYMKLTVQYQGACAVLPTEAQKCAGNEECYVCDLTSIGVSIEDRPLEVAQCAAGVIDTKFSFECLGVREVAEEKLDSINDVIKATDEDIAAAEQALADAGCTLGTISGACAPLIEAVEDLKRVRSNQEAAKARQTVLAETGDSVKADKAEKAARAKGELDEKQAEADKAKEQATAICDEAPNGAACRTLQEEVASFEKDLAILEQEYNTLKSDAGDTSNDAKEASEGGSGGIIAAVLVVIVLLIIVAAVMLYFNNEKKKAELDEKARTYGDIRNANYSDPRDLDEARFTPGQKNPLYDWYHPSLDRDATEAQLANAPQGGFIVRDSKSSPGWFMLDVKTAGGGFAHDKIRNSDDDKYELMIEGPAQPAFDSLPLLVDHYTTQQAGMPYQLTLANSVQAQLQTTDSMSNPMYDAMAQQQAAPATYDDVAYDGVGGQPPAGGYMDVSA